MKEKNKRAGSVIKTWFKFFNGLRGVKKYMLMIWAVMAAMAINESIMPMTFGWLIDGFVAKKNLTGVHLVFLTYGALAILQAFLVYSILRLGGIVEAKSAYQMRANIFDKLQRLSFSYYDKEGAGKILSRISADASTVAIEIGWGFMDFVYVPFMMTGNFIIMSMMSARLTGIVLLSVPLFLAFYYLFNDKLIQVNRIARTQNSEVISAMSEGINGTKTTKTLGIEQTKKTEFNVKSQKLRFLNTRAQRMGNMFHPFTLLIEGIIIALVLFSGSKEVLGGMMTYGQLAVFLTIASSFLFPLKLVSQLISSLIASQAALERVRDIIEEKEDISDSDSVIEKYGNLYEQKRENWEEIKGDVLFENVSFWYKEAQPILQDFNLDIKAGMSVALVGETGAGKSTIVNLACRFYEPSNGRILIDGEDYRKKSLSWLRSKMGYVLQSPHLFSGTIRQNIRYGNLDASDLEIENAVKLIGAKSTFDGLENGLETEVGEGGSLLSTGEKQLVSFARAIIADPKLLFLDEATSSVDTKSEMRIQYAIQKILKGRTSFVIAHRLSTIKNSDLILFIEKGRIAEKGTHKELMLAKGRYFELVQKQYKSIPECI